MKPDAALVPKGGWESAAGDSDRAGPGFVPGPGLLRQPGWGDGSGGPRSHDGDVPS
jgi:hypothetical protein